MNRYLVVMGLTLAPEILNIALLSSFAYYTWWVNWDYVVFGEVGHLPIRFCLWCFFGGERRGYFILFLKKPYVNFFMFA